jgi:SAM-dependent methyltransferase
VKPDPDPRNTLPDRIERHPVEAMSIDITDLRGFYASPLGAVTRRFVGRAIDRFWGHLTGLRVLGLGYAPPYLSAVKDDSERTLAFMPANQGVVNWPGTGASASALVDPLMMPLPDASIDRVLVVHALETVESPSELLHEIWRILTPGGRIILVAPNRRGLWARMDTTPFGYGQPYSRSQLKSLMRQTWFSPEGWAETLYVPPLRNRFLLQTAQAWEQVGAGFSLPFAGLHIVEATKQLYRPGAVHAVRRSRRLAPVFVPAPAAPASRMTPSSLIPPGFAGVRQGST